MPRICHCYHTLCHDVCLCPATACDYEIERTFRLERYLSKLEAQKEREKERLRLAKEMEAREAARAAKYQELLKAEEEARAKRQAEREAELLKASQIRAEIRDLKHKRRQIEAETVSLSGKHFILSCGCYDTCCCLPTYYVPRVHVHSHCCSHVCSCYCCI